MGSNVTLSKKDIILGTYEPELYLLNLLILITKQYIYAKKCLKSDRLQVFEVISIFERTFRVELHMAREKNVENTCEQKWGILYNYWKE